MNTQTGLQSMVNLGGDRIHRDNLRNDGRGGATVYSLHCFLHIDFLLLLLLLIFCRIGGRDFCGVR
jgi:hypothetical protein